MSSSVSANIPAEKQDPYKAKYLDVSASVKEKIDDYGNFVDSQKVGMLTTRCKDGSLVSRAMQLSARENAVDLTFITNVCTGKVGQLQEDNHVNVSFIKEVQGEWVSVSGKASVTTDRDVVKKHYSAMLKIFFKDLGDGVHDGSENDPRIGIVHVKTNTVTYEIQPVSKVTKLAQEAKEAITGESPIYIIRELNAGEIQIGRSMYAKET